MKKILNILSAITLVIILFLVGTYLYLTNFGKNEIYFGPRNSKMEIPITYTIGAGWNHQDDLIIDNFSVKIVRSNLSMRNNKSLISYTIKGQIKFARHYEASIKKVHISERLNKDSTQCFDRIIELMPIVKIQYNGKVNESGIKHFEFTNEYIVTSGHWGVNNIKIICGNNKKDIKFRQKK